MSLTTKPPTGDALVRPDAPPPAAARPPGTRAPALEEGAALKLLVNELIAIVTADLGTRPAPPGAAIFLRDPGGVARALIAWLSAATESGGLKPERLATLIERAYGRVLEILARLPGSPGGPEASVRLARNVLLAELLAAPPSLRTHAAGLMPLKLLVAELERAVTEELGRLPPAPRPTAGEDPGNVASGLLRWLRAAATATNLPLGRLRGALDRALERSRAMLIEDAALPAALDELDQAREVLIAAIGRAPRAESPVPTFRPDLPVAPPGAVRGRRDPRAQAREPHDGSDGDEPVASAADEPEDSPPALDLKGPMELIRRYLEDLESGEPGRPTRHFVYPACRWQGGRWEAFADAPALAQACLARGRAPPARGLGGGKILMLRVEPVGPTIATVRALIERAGTPGARPEEVEVAYTTVLTPEGWRIAVLMLR